MTASDNCRVLAILTLTSILHGTELVSPDCALDRPINQPVPTNRSVTGIGDALPTETMANDRPPRLSAEHVDGPPLEPPKAVLSQPNSPLGRHIARWFLGVLPAIILLTAISAWTAVTRWMGRPPDRNHE
jgi:hypothetical protein